MRLLKKTNLPITLLILVILFSTFIYAAPPFISTSQANSNYISIETPIFTEYKYNEDIKLHFHVYNSTGILLTNLTTGCLFHLYNQSENHIIESSLYFDTNGIDFYMNLSKSLFKKDFFYQYIVDCRSVGFGGYVVNGFTIKEEVIDKVSVSKVIESNPLYVIIGFILIMIFYLFMGYTNFKIEKVEAMRLGLFTYGIAFIELLLCIAYIYGYELGLNMILLLQINFYSILLITFGIGMLSLIFNYINILDFTKKEDDVKKWNKEEWK